MDANLIGKFESFGLKEKRLDEVSKNKKVSKSFDEIINASSASTVSDEKKIANLHILAIELKGNELDNLKLIVDGIVDGRLASSLQISEAVKYVKKAGSEATNDGLESASGVGIEVGDEEVKEIITKHLDSIKGEIEEKRYSFLPKMLGQAKTIPGLKWAKPSLFKPIIDEYFLSVLGPKDDRDVVKKEKKKKPVKEAASGNAEVVEERTMFAEGFLGELHKPGENPQKYPELMKEHLKFTKGKVFSRFPPEPNGYLHIGHSKAIMVNFGYAAYHEGNCYLRFDDTNPEAEEEKFFTKIEETIKWLGYEPWKITYSSDYFDELYELAEQLIKAGKAYVDHSTPEEVKAQRGLKEDGTLGGERFASKWRERSVEDNLTEFRKMRDGEYAVGTAFLRMKQDLTSPNPQMWDLAAYRVLNKPHHRTGSKWKIYPTYDFTHCLVDSFENISHSLCTTEFRLSRESYEWLCDELKVYRPAQREYGRLNLTGTVLSKRKIAKLVNEKHVRDWDDPRLYTLEAIRRRGVPPGGILSFINTLGVTTSTTNIQIARFESAIRTYLDATTPRLMMLCQPLEIEIDNVDEGFEEEVEVPFQKGLDSRKLKFGKRIYIDRDDFREETSTEYFRLAPGQAVGLMKVPFNVSVNKVIKDESGEIIKVHCNYDNEGKRAKPKTFIQWLPKDNIKIDQIRVYNQLFNSENPAAHPDGFLKDINQDSEIIIKGAMIEKSFNLVKEKSPLNIPIPGGKFNVKEDKGNETIRFQALRVGYFCVDKESTEDKLILNRIVTLKEDSSKA